MSLYCANEVNNLCMQVLIYVRAAVKMQAVITVHQLYVVSIKPVIFQRLNNFLK